MKKRLLGRKGTRLAALMMTAAMVATTFAGACVSSAEENSQLDLMESPVLTEMVESGEIPELSERIPENPKIVVPLEDYGVYGGTWRQNIMIGLKGHAITMIGAYQGMKLAVWNTDCTEIIPNIAESIELSDDAKSCTITLRKGLKWSDGEPMTTEDILFCWEGYMVNETLRPGNTAWAGTELAVVDDVTYTMTFQEPKPFLLAKMADQSDSTPWFLPKHYLEQFHGDFNEGAGDLAEELGFDSWLNCFVDRMDYQSNPDLPVMSPWVLTTDSTAATQIVFERNPYYWATDDKGRQLPYIDTCVLNIVESDDIGLMKNVSGEFELVAAGVMEDFANYPLYMENAETAGYTVCTSDWDDPNAMNIHINVTHPDEVKRSYFSQPDFRKALSLAINRQELIDVQFTMGIYQSEIAQFSPTPKSPFFDEEMATQYTEYDVEQANALLDGLGLTEKNSDGYRVMSDGNVLSIVIEIPNYSDQWLDVGNMIAEYWRAVGVNASTVLEDPGLWETNCNANNFDCSIFTGGGGFETLCEITVNDYTGYDFFAWPQRYSAGAYLWRAAQQDESVENSENAVEPEQYLKDLWDLGARLVKEPDEETQKELVSEILKIHRDNLLILGIGRRLPALYLVKNTMHNVPTLYMSWTYGFTAHGGPDQYYIQ